mmetsp:Transcript_5844/g.10544  ORF Transcript_5844/g.10544 Transcript_5844/m.10544 type:complete len:257 (-) Transcript_5844:54-824(-)
MWQFRLGMILHLSMYSGMVSLMALSATINIFFITLRKKRMVCGFTLDSSMKMVISFWTTTEFTRVGFICATRRYTALASVTMSSHIFLPSRMTGRLKQSTSHSEETAPQSKSSGTSDFLAISLVFSFGFSVVALSTHLKSFLLAPRDLLRARTAGASAAKVAKLKPREKLDVSSAGPAASIPEVDMYFVGESEVDLGSTKEPGAATSAVLVEEGATKAVQQNAAAPAAPAAMDSVRPVAGIFDGSAGICSEGCLSG